MDESCYRALRLTKRTTLLVLLDFSVAFINHDIFLEQLKVVGVTAIQWFLSYLQGCFQKVVMWGALLITMGLFLWCPTEFHLSPHAISFLFRIQLR